MTQTGPADHPAVKDTLCDRGLCAIFLLHSVLLAEQSLLFPE